MCGYLYSLLNYRLNWDETFRLLGSSTRFRGYVLISDKFVQKTSLLEEECFFFLFLQIIIRMVYLPTQKGGGISIITFPNYASWRTSIVKSESGSLIECKCMFSVWYVEE